MTHQAPSPSFTTDILSKFRPDDIACMRPMGVRLADPNWMTDPGGDAQHADFANARHVFDQLQTRRMPPDAPWSDDWLATYGAWMAGGFQP